MFKQPLNPLFQRGGITVREVEQLIESGQPIQAVMPLTLQLSDDSWWELPYEPLISVVCENVIVKRNVAKSSGRGSIKERWSEGDIKIDISGTFINDDLNSYPSMEVQRLREVLTQRRAIGVQNELLQLLNVNQIVVEKFSLPFSKGENVQNYTIEALSDDSYNLFIEIK